MEKMKKRMRLTILFFLLSSLSLLLTVIGDYQGEWWNVAAAIGVGVCFWLFELIGYLCFWGVSKGRKAQEKKDRPSKEKKKPGIIVFFSNPYARAADIVMILSFIGSVATQFFPFSEIVSLVFAAAFVFSAQMHAILNGINFQYIYIYIKKDY